MPLVKLTDSCYEALAELKKQITEDKKARQIAGKTTFSEVVFNLISERRK